MALRCVSSGPDFLGLVFSIEINIGSTNANPERSSWKATVLFCIQLRCGKLREEQSPPNFVVNFSIAGK
jgi:hypothetical protein